MNEVAQACFRIERPERALEIALKLKDETFDPSERDKARAIARLASHMVFAGKPAISAALVEKLETVDASADPGVRAMVHNARATIALQGGDTETYVEETAVSVTLHEVAGDHRNACLQRVNLGNAYADIGRLDEAVTELRAAREEAKALKVPFAELIAMVNLGYALSYLGALDEARALEAEVVARMGEAKNARIVAAARIYYAIACCLAGDFGAAEFAARAAVRETAATPPLHAYALAAQARAELGQLRRREARDTAARAMAIIDDIGAIDAGDALVRLTFAEALFAAGELEQAKERIRAAKDRLLSRAKLIEDETTRNAFLKRIPEHAATLDRAREWLE
jgi:tetratricopeptide (TPR) repeat protein